MTDVAILKQQMGLVEPIALAKDINCIKGAVSALANVLHADLEPEP